MRVNTNPAAGGHGRRRLLGLAVGLALTACGVPGGASATGPATPATLAGLLKNVSGGEVIKLQPGDYGEVRFPRRAYTPAIRIDASAARFSGVVLDGTSGVELSGGIIVGGGGRSYGVSIKRAERIAIRDMHISGAHRGIVVAQSSDIKLVGNELTGLISDGINVALSRRVLIERNSCRNFNPRPATYDAEGRRLKDGDHPDCIQAWSRPSDPPTADLRIIGNTAEGYMQGIFLGNHVRNGVDDGGFDRVEIRNNRVKVAVPNGITASGVRDGVVTDNIVETVPGAVMINKPQVRVKAKLLIKGDRTIVCGNRVTAVSSLPGEERCRKR